MRWTRTKKISVTLAVFAAVAIGALPAARWINAQPDTQLEKDDYTSPNPYTGYSRAMVEDLLKREISQDEENDSTIVVATAGETRDIVEAVLKNVNFFINPPEPDEAAIPETQRILLLEEQSHVFTKQPKDSSRSYAGRDFAGLDGFATPSFRAKHEAANKVPREFGLSGIPGTAVVRSSDVTENFGVMALQKHLEKYPHTAGFAQVTQPVLNRKRTLALIYVSHVCGGLCGTGTVFLLTRSESGWRVVQSELQWIS